MALDPTGVYKKYHGFDVSGFRFHIVSRDESRQTQTSGILYRGEDNSIEEYYGILEDIWRLHYTSGNIV